MWRKEIFVKMQQKINKKERYATARRARPFAWTRRWTRKKRERGKGGERKKNKLRGSSRAPSLPACPLSSISTGDRKYIGSTCVSVCSAPCIHMYKHVHVYSVSRVLVLEKPGEGFGTLVWFSPGWPGGPLRLWWFYCWGWQTPDGWMPYLTKMSPKEW